MAKRWGTFVSDSGRAADRDIDELVAQLPPEAAGRLYEEIESSSGARSEAVRKALTSKLNAARRQHARRLFTDLFRPLLTRDTLLLRAEFAGPGVVHPLDVGALWARLADKPLAALAKQADARLHELAAAMPLRVAFRNGDVLALQEEMRRQAVAALQSALAGAQGGKGWVEELNRWRNQEGNRTRLGFEPRPWTVEDLKLVLAVLAEAQALSDHVARLRHAARDPDGLAAVLSNHAALTGDALARVGHVGPLALLHADRNYLSSRIVLSYGPPVWHESAVAALVRHLGRTCFALVEEVMGAIGANSVVRAGLLLPLQRRDALDRELGCLDVLLGVLEDMDLVNHPRFGAHAREHLDRMVRKVEAELYPVLADRCIVECRSLARPIADLEAVDWMLTFCARWRAVLKRSLYWGTGFTEFRDRVLEELRDGYRGTFTRQGYDTPAQRMAHAVRLSQLGSRLGGSAEGWVGLLDQGVVRTVGDRLRDPTPLSVGESVLVRTFADLVEQELRRTRHWKDVALQDIQELAKTRLAAAGL